MSDFFNYLYLQKNEIKNKKKKMEKKRSFKLKPRNLIIFYLTFPAFSLLALSFFSSLWAMKDDNIAPRRLRTHLQLHTPPLTLRREVLDFPVKRKPDVKGYIGNFKVARSNCDASKGRWVFDESYPLYTNVSCPFIDRGFDCRANGRLDTDYMKWRWQPQDCDIPRFNATGMLEAIRGKRLVFVGDSINRNQWESMLCLLMRAVKDPKRVYETHGRRITKEKGHYSFRFLDYRCTVEFHVTHYLVHESNARVGGKRTPTLRIDTIDRSSSRWRGADILVFNTANWWTHSKTSSGVNYYQEGKLVHTHMEVLTAFRRALTTWATWVDSRIDPRKTRVFFRSSTPSHFSGGEWNTGGHCKEAETPTNSSRITNPEKDLIAMEIIKNMKTPVTFLNVTGLSGYRIDGHPSVYGSRSRNKVQDCSHWCLPGVPDTWNELLYYHLVSEQGANLNSS